MSRLPDEEPRPLGALLRVPAAAVNRAIFAHLQGRFPDFRESYQPVFQYIDHPPYGPAGTRLTDLAGRAGLSKQALIEVIDEMEQRGYVRRVPDPGDRRAKLICLTKRGLAVHHEAFGAIANVDADWSSRIGVDSLNQLKDLLERLNAALELDVHLRPRQSRRREPERAPDDGPDG